MPSDRVRHRTVPPVAEEAELVQEPHEHTHEVPERSLLPQNIALVLLFVMLCAGLWKDWDTDRRLTELEEYVGDARVARDQQAEQLEELVRQQACGFLDRLPAGPLWDPVREENGCGPGMDPSAFDPGEVAQLMDSYGVATFPTTPDQLYAMIPPPIGDPP